MDIKGILYQSGSGHAKEYAELLSKQWNVPAYDLFSAVRSLKKGTPVLFIGWVRNRELMGYGLMLKRYSIKAVCAVGAVEMEYGQYVLDRIARRAHIREDISLFYLRGGFDSKLVRGSDRKLVSALIDTLARKIVRCEKKNQAVHVYDKALFSALTCGGDFVCTENLSNIVEWYDTL